MNYRTELQEVDRVVRDCLERAGGPDLLIEVKWSGTLRRDVLGQCLFLGRRRMLTFNQSLWRHATPDQRREVVVHEVAHAIVGPGHGHGPLWQEAMLALGAEPNQFHGVRVHIPTRSFRRVW